MTHLIVCLIVWITVLLAIPFKRIQELRSVLIVSFLWMLLLNNIFVSLGYYSYHNMILPFGRVPLFQLLAYGGIGMLMINWLNENSLTKIISVISVAVIFAFVENIYLVTGAFAYGKFDVTLSFIYHIAALSLFTWISLYVVGEHKVYYGDKSFSIIKKLI